MNPWGLLVIAIGVTSVVAGVRGSYRDIWKMVTGQATTLGQTTGGSASQTGGSSGSVAGGSSGNFVP